MNRYSLLLIFLMVISIFSSNSNLISSQDEIEATIRYEFLFSGNQTFQWQNHDHTVNFTYNINRNSNITVEIFEMNNYNSKINIKIGNLTRTRILDTEAESNLNIGIDEIVGHLGFVANINWTELDLLISSVGLNSYTIHDFPISILGDQRDVIMISFLNNSRSTELTYDKESGMLLRANTQVLGIGIYFEVTSLVITPSIASRNQNMDYLSLVLMLPLMIKLMRWITKKDISANNLKGNT